MAWLADIPGADVDRVAEASSNDGPSRLRDSGDASRLQESVDGFGDSDPAPAAIVIFGGDTPTAKQIGARVLQVPALLHDIGRPIWWPSRLNRRDTIATRGGQRA